MWLGLEKLNLMAMKMTSTGKWPNGKWPWYEILKKFKGKWPKNEIGKWPSYFSKKKLEENDQTFGVNDFISAILKVKQTYK